MNRARVEQLVGELVGELVGAREAARLSDTPAGVAAWLAARAVGSLEAPGPGPSAESPSRSDAGLTVARDLELVSLCEHHLLPFFGRCHLAVLGGRRPEPGWPRGVVAATAGRLQLQERLTEEIARRLVTELAPRGVAVAIEARHLCMQMRGVAKQRATVSTSSVWGELREPAIRAQFIAQAIGRGREAAP